MFKLASLRSRLIAVYVGLIVVGLGSFTLWTGRQMAQNAYNDFGNNLQVHTLLLANQLLEPMEDNPAKVVQLIDHSAENLDATVTVFSPAGNILYTSNPLAQTVPVSTTTYIQQPAPDGTPMVYSMAAILEDDGPIAYVQVEVPAEIPGETVRERWLALGAGFVGFSAVALALSLWLLTTLTTPLSRLRLTALNMADGDLSHRVTNLPADEIGEVGTAFNKMAGRVEKMVAEQRAFASNASHELRTPLTTIRLRTEWLLSGQLPDQTAHQYMVDIDEEALRMSHLVEDLLLLSRLDAHNITAGNEEIDASRLLRQLHHEYAPLAEAKKIALTITRPETPCPIQANPNHVRVVYRNILDNALKYTPNNGRVTATLSCENGAVLFRVEDTGRGIDPADLPHIGQRFYRADKARSRDIQGTGLGLALVHAILDLYGGSMEITSAGREQGTAVLIHWPPPKLNDASNTQ